MIKQIHGLKNSLKVLHQLYKRICDLVRGFVVSIKNYFDVEIDEEANFHLVKDLTTKLMTQIIKRIKNKK